MFEYLRIFTEEKELPKESELYSFNREFFLGNLSDYIKIYKKEDVFYYVVFEKIFKVEKVSFDKEYALENKDKLKELFGKYLKADEESVADYRYVYVLFSNKQKILTNNLDNAEQIISYALRGSNTLRKTNDNFFNNLSIEMLVSPTGIYSDCNLALQKIRIVMVYVLAIYYILTTRDYIKQIASYKDEQDIINIREKILDYDIRYFFKNPIRQSKHELYMVYELISKVYKINELYLEIKEQVKDSAKILEIKLERKKQNRFKVFKYILAFITTTITLANIFPAIDAGKNILIYLGVLK